MTKCSKEKLSALMDGELEIGVTSRLIDVVSRDAELRAAWTRYHLVRDVVRDQVAPVAPGDFARRVENALELEPTLAAVRRRRSRLRPIAGLALAASMAGLAVFGVKSIWYPSQSTPAPTSVAAAPRLQTSALRWNVSQPAVEERLDGYLVNHSEYLGNGLRGLLPYARIVGYDGIDQK